MAAGPTKPADDWVARRIGANPPQPLVALHSAAASRSPGRDRNAGKPVHCGQQPRATRGAQALPAYLRPAGRRVAGRGAFREVRDRDRAELRPADGERPERAGAGVSVARRRRDGPRQGRGAGRVDGVGRLIAAGGQFMTGSSGEILLQSLREAMLEALNSFSPEGIVQIPDRRRVELSDEGALQLGALSGQHVQDKSDSPSGRG